MTRTARRRVERPATARSIQDDLARRPQPGDPQRELETGGGDTGHPLGEFGQFAHGVPVAGDEVVLAASRLHLGGHRGRHDIAHVDPVVAACDQRGNPPAVEVKKNLTHWGWLPIAGTDHTGWIQDHCIEAPVDAAMDFNLTGGL